MAAAQRDRDVAVARKLDDERDLVLESEFGVALSVERECMKLFWGDDIGEAVWARVGGASEAGDQRVLVSMASKRDLQVFRRCRVRDGEHVVRVGADLVEGYPVALDRAAEGVEQAVA